PNAVESDTLLQRVMRCCRNFVHFWHLECARDIQENSELICEVHVRADIRHGRREIDGGAPSVCLGVRRCRRCIQAGQKLPRLITCLVSRKWASDYRSEYSAICAPAVRSSPGDDLNREPFLAQPGHHGADGDRTGCSLTVRLTAL